MNCLALGNFDCSCRCYEIADFHIVEISINETKYNTRLIDEKVKAAHSIIFMRNIFFGISYVTILEDETKEQYKRIHLVYLENSKPICIYFKFMHNFSTFF